MQLLVNLFYVATKIHKTTIQSKLLLCTNVLVLIVVLSVHVVLLKIPHEYTIQAQSHWIKYFSCANG